MPGMNSGSNSFDPAIAAAFRSALLHQGLVALVILFVAFVIFMIFVRRRGLVIVASAEPAGRRLLVAGFGILWLLDGILQAQPNMPAGLPSQVIEPTAGASPPWVRDVVHWGQAAWTSHPVGAGSATVWIQIGLGLWLLVAPRGELSRLAGLASAGWGLIVGVRRVVRRAVRSRPDVADRRARRGARLRGGRGPDRAARSRLALTAAGPTDHGRARPLPGRDGGVQAQPSLGFWRGVSYGQPAPLAAMIQSMSHTPQPSSLSAWVSAFGAFEEAYAFAVNLVVVVALAFCGAAFLSGRPRLIRPALGVFAVLCLADWVLIQDLGFLGGLGTDPNSMIPFVLLAAGGYLALTRVLAPPAEREPVPETHQEIVRTN